MVADIEIAIAENLHSRHATRGTIAKSDPTSIAIADPAVGYQGGIVRAGVV